MAADNLRQRRGKKTSAASGDGPSSSGTDADEKPAPIEQLRGAHARLVLSRERTADLHAAWRNQLFRLSLLVVVVTVHQLQSSISSCIHEIKDGGEGEEGGTAVTGAQAVRLIFSDSFCEIWGVAIAALLAYFLARSSHSGNALDLSLMVYIVSSAMVPICLGCYFHSSKVGCVGGGSDVEEVSDDATNADRHQFPVVVIYHTIVTVAAWFMSSGMQKCEEHVKMVEDSMRDFERMDKKMELRKKLLKEKARAKKK